MSNEERSQNNLTMIEWFIKHQVSTQLMCTDSAIVKAIDYTNKSN